MAFFNFLLATMALLVSTIHAQDMYVPVEGNCDALKDILDPKSYTEVGAGNYYVQNASFAGGSCVYGYCVKRGNEVYGDMHMLPDGKTTTEDVVFFPNDMKYNPESKTYTDQAGATGYVLIINLEKHIFFAQCKVEDGKSKITMMFATRYPKATTEDKEVYEVYRKKLEDNKLLPKMTQVSQENCVPVNNVKLD